MNIPYIEKYMEDLTGAAKTNLVEMEPFEIRGDGLDSIKVAQEGLFYIDSLKVYDKNKNELEKWWDYKPVYIFPEATKYTGQGVTGFVQILNKDLVEGGYMTYQVVGGHWSYVSQTLIDLLWAAISDTRNVFYDDVLNRPSLFPPSYHTHNINRTYGYEARTGLVEQIIDDIIVRADDTRAQYLKKHVDVVREYVNARYDEIVQWLNDHKSNRVAHGETGDTIGITNLQNLGTATTAEAVEGSRVDVRMTVAGMKASVDDAALNTANTYLHTGVLPITRYGGLLYMEPSVQGSYEGSSQYSIDDVRLMIEEYDGTIVRLRPGTNGTSVGVYYDYMYNPFTDANAKFIRTNAIYWPSDLGIWKPLSLRQSTPDVIWGLCYNSTLFPTLSTTAFISITNDTFDQTRHTSAKFTPTFNHPVIGVRTLSPRAYMTIIDDWVYCFDVGNWGDDAPMGIVILRTPVSGIKDGATITFELMNDITSSGGPYGNVVGAGAYLAPKTLSTISTDQAMFITQPGLTNAIYPFDSLYFYVEHNGINDIRIVMGCWCYFSTTSGYIGPHLGWRVRYNTTAKTATWVDTPQTVVVTINSSNLPVLQANPASNITYAKLSLASILTSTNNGWNDRGAQYISRSTGNYIKTWSYSDVNSNNLISIGKIDNWVVGGTNWDVVNRAVTESRIFPDSTEFGSAVMNNLRYPVGLPNGYVNIANNDTNNVIGSTCVRYVGDNNHVYQAINVGAVTGYGPTTDRKITGRNLMHRYISYWDGGALSVNGGILTPWANGTTSAVDASGNPVDLTQVTWDINELNAAALAFASTLDIAGSVTNALCDIVIHPNAATPILAYVAVTYNRTPTTRDARLYITKVNYNGPRTGNITGYSLQTTGYLSMTYGLSNVTGLGNGWFQPGCNMYRSGNYLLITIGSSTWTGVVGNARANTASLVYDLTTGTMTLVGWIESEVVTGRIGYWPTILADKGMVCMDGVSSGLTYGTLMFCLPMGNTRDDFMAFNYNDKSKRFVLVAQEVTQGWVVYFTESLPVILNGREGVVPAMSIDLRSIIADPSNRTFYVYVIDLGDTFTHQIVTAPLAELNNRAFIGTVVTGPAQISSINISKLTRIGTYRLSTEKVGSAIPVSTGSYTGIGDWVIENI